MVEVVSVCGLNNVFESALLFGECIKVCIGFGVVGVDFLQPAECIDGLLNPFFDITTHILVCIELRFLGEIAYLDAGLGPRFAKDIVIQPRHDAQQGRLARSVEAKYADLGSGEKGERNILQDCFFGRHDFADPVHSEDVLSH